MAQGDGPARRPSEMAQRDGPARWPSEMAQRDGPARWPSIDENWIRVDNLGKINHNSIFEHKRRFRGVNALRAAGLTTRANAGAHFPKTFTRFPGSSQPRRADYRYE